MKKWAVFSDVDGTIYGFPNKILPLENELKAIELEKRNVPFIINTGNGPLEKIQRLAEKLKSKYIVCASGAVVYDNIDKKYLHVEYIPLDVAKKVFDLANKFNFPLYYFGIDQYYMHNYSKNMYKFLTDFCEYDKWILDGRINQDIHKIEFYGTEQQIIDANKELLKANLDQELTIMFMGTHIEIVKKGVDKGTGMKWLCDNVLQTNLEDVMAIGDSANDLGMFNLAGYTYAMDNADILTKSHAKYHARDVNQAGLAHAIDDYLYRSDFELKRQISQQQSKKK
ncbi:Cof-type HAD-IIB family hydrolase [Mycoplasmopsis alligatoris]|uniref:HAD hydrolase, family IIB n=1 Tax=Mycoplasmopsis alligatoris A21JP2 TaxID=747682 RepID=D4XV45_9BACT|nr:HAD family hydrolase [Mycoplasmopsis alligatoris]EFF41754.1 HAD hydrolase, family IIB [Mycoplasmopsis alligatoris A21JP2]